MELIASGDFYPRGVDSVTTLVGMAESLIAKTATKMLSG
jgi:hypothetical protein